jgi:DNA repair protein RadC
MKTIPRGTAATTSNPPGNKAGRFYQTPEVTRLPINTPAKLALLWHQEINPLKPDAPPGMEAMAVIYIDHAGCLIDWTVLGVGILGVTADVRVIIAEGEKLHAKAFALVHNHPPGYSLTPSKEDLSTVCYLDSEVATDDFKFYDSVIVNAHGCRSIKQDRYYHLGSPPSGHSRSSFRRGGVQ